MNLNANMLNPIKPAIDATKEVMRIVNTAGLSKDVIDLLKTKLDLVDRDVTELREKNAELSAKLAKVEAENAQLRAQISSSPAQRDMVENEGALWRRKNGGGFEHYPYCNECPNHPVMRPMHGARIFVCSEGHSVPLDTNPPGE
jgi:hypothetical protein